MTYTEPQHEAKIRDMNVVLEQIFDYGSEGIEILHCTAAEWLDDNSDDDECINALPQILAGERVLFGGGAAPCVTVRIAE